MVTLLLLITITTAPDPQLTPGLVRPLTLHVICSTTWGLDRRHVTVAMKRRVLAAYGRTWADRTTVEVDHLIPRELGGADDVLNLWPQPRAEAHRKDVEENRLHRAVCAGAMPLATAQSQMSRWGTIQ